MKILILASNPRNDLNLNGEIRLLRSVIDRSRYRDQFEVVSEPEVQVGDLQRLLLRHTPQIVHFCGHGSGKEGLIFKREEGGEQWVGADALADMFRLNPICQHVRCVLLNACYSEEQASAIVSQIDYVVGMSHEIQDNSAIAFSKGFYLALGEGCSIEDSFEFGKNAIQLEMSGSSKMRSAVTEQQRKAEVVDVVTTIVIPDHLKPILKRKEVLTFGSDHGGSAANTTLSEEKRVAIQVEVDKALEPQEPGLKQYRDRVRYFLSDRKLSITEALRLEQLRKDLRLSEMEASQILAEELEPIQKGRDEYETTLIGLIDKGYYPLDAATKAELLALRQELGLIDEEVKAIEMPILEAAEKEHQTKQAQQAQQEYEQNLNRYKQAFSEAIASQYPIALLVCEHLNQLHLSLGLSNEDVARIEEIAAPKKVVIEDLGRDVTLEMVAIPGGTFSMGCELELNESPQHSVTVQPFFMGKFAITQAQWRAVAALSKINIELNLDPSDFKGAKRPVEKISWNQAVEFCDRLSQKTGKHYRLPSEAEWEYACRAGTTTPFCCGETIATDLANYNDNSTNDNSTKEIGSFPPNTFGLYEMHGNVWEWCADHWHENYQGAPADGSAWITGGKSDRRAMRGGSWFSNPRYCRSASRYCNVPSTQYHGLGFRVVCGLV